MNPRTSRITVSAVLHDALDAAISTLDGAADGTILPEQVSSHLMQWETTFELYCEELPDHARHLGRSLRMAFGEALGGVALSSIDERMVAYPIAPHDEQWNETGRRYALYCAEWIRRWGTPGMFRRSRRPKTFDAWLMARGN